MAAVGPAKRAFRRLAPLVGAGLLASGCAMASAYRSGLTAEEHNDLGVAYLGRGRSELAVREFERAVARRPGWALAQRNLGDAYMVQGDRPAAIRAYEAALRASPGDPGVANNLAHALLDHPARWREAEPLVRAALARAPEPRGYYLDTLGLSLLRRGASVEAVQAFRGALADPALADPGVRESVLRHAAEALAAVGDGEGACRCQKAADRVRQRTVGGLQAVC